MKATYPSLTFNKQYFKKHQGVLLWLLNTPIVRGWFRYVMRINGGRSSLGKNLVEGIRPNSITWRINETQRVSEFRTHNKFAKRLFRAFKLLWYFFHFLDWFILDREPFAKLGLSLGHTVTTVYPDPDPETNTVDGNVLRSVASEDYSVLRSGAGTGSSDNGGSFNLRTQTDADNITDKWNAIERGIMLYDTSPISDGDTIDSAILSLYGDQSTDNYSTEPETTIVASTPASDTALEDADYGQLGTTELTDTRINHTTINIGSYNDFTLNSSGLSNISKTGLSKFGIRSGWDFDGTPPTWADTASRQLYTGSEYTGTSRDSKLAVTHSTPASDSHLQTDPYFY